MRLKIVVSIVAFFFFFSGFSQVSDFKEIDFTRADNIAKLNEGESLRNLPLLTHKLTHKLNTDIEKFRAIYTWVCLNIKGDDKQNTVVTHNRKKLKNDSIALINWNKKHKKVSFKRLLTHKKTVCTGYAYLLKQMAKIADIECVIVDGYGRVVDVNANELERVNHSWNAVKINNKWYLCDATWASGYSDGNGTFIQDYNDGYFLTNPKTFAKNHFPLEKKWLLTSNQTSENFVTAPLIYSETFKHNVFPVKPNKMQVIVKRKEPVNFEFQSLKNIEKKDISLETISRNKYKKLSIYNVENTNGLLKFKYKFSSKGYYDVHLKIKNDVVATYTFKVVKN